ncbi:MAG: acyl-CoA dehydratase activase [Candidatus Thermoplasmatota archaeon]
MISAGIDIGAKYVKAVIMEDGKLVSKSCILCGFDQKKAAENAIEKSLKNAGISMQNIEKIASTGSGRKVLQYPDITDVTADAKGSAYFIKNVRTVIDVGAEEGRAIKCSADGKVIDFAINEKCAAGAGAFTEAMARALEINVEDMGSLSLRSKNAVPMNAQCVVFAESEVVTLVHAKTPKEDIARAVHDAIASRIASMVRRIGIEKEVVLIGGVAKNIGFVDSLKKALEIDIIVPEEPEFISAVGAAVIAAGG